MDEAYKTSAPGQSPHPNQQPEVESQSPTSPPQWQFKPQPTPTPAEVPRAPDQITRLQETPVKPKFFRRVWFWLILVLGLLFVLVYISISFIPLNYLSVSHQPFGDRVQINKASLARGGFVVIRNANEYGKPQGLVGHTIFLPPDRYEDFEIEFAELGGENPPEIKAGDIVFVQIFYDNGNQLFDIQEDIPVRNLGGKIMTKSLILK